MKLTAEMMGAIIPYLRPEVSIDEVRENLAAASDPFPIMTGFIGAIKSAGAPRVYTDRDLLELFRMLLRQQINDERINNITELHGLLAHVEEALA